jgi:CelD/BcsL family acetyltransferase involved in cellulose biosynthesis
MAFVSASLTTAVPRVHDALGSARIETIADPRVFADMRKEWTELLESSAADCLFLTWEWLHTWYAHLSRGCRLHVITARSGGELIAIAPLMVCPPRVTRLVPFRSLEFLGTGSVGSDYLDVVLRRGREEEGLDALAASLADGGMALDLGQLRRTSCLAQGLADRLARRGWQATARASDVCPFIRLSGLTWPDYLASLDGHHRGNFRRRLNHLGKAFEMRFEPARSETERRDALRAFVDLHQLRWRTRGGTTALYAPELIAFHEEWTRLALDRGWLRLYVMRLDGRAVAAVYGLRYRDTFCFYQTGFDPSYARHGVGQVAIGLSIKSAIEEGADAYDLLHGDEPYKFDWARETRELGRIELYPGSVRGRLHQNMADVGRRARKMARRLMPDALADRIAGGRGVGV